MAVSNQFVLTLARWGKRKDANKLQLEKWLDEAITGAGSGKGQIASANAGGGSFSKIFEMSESERASVLSRALDMIDRGITHNQTSFGA